MSKQPLANLPIPGFRIPRLDRDHLPWLVGGAACILLSLLITLQYGTIGGPRDPKDKKQKRSGSHSTHNHILFHHHDGVDSGRSSGKNRGRSSHGSQPRSSRDGGHRRGSQSSVTGTLSKQSSSKVPAPSLVKSGNSMRLNLKIDLSDRYIKNLLKTLDGLLPSGCVQPEIDATASVGGLPVVSPAISAPIAGVTADEIELEIVRAVVNNLLTVPSSGTAKKGLRKANSGFFRSDDAGTTGKPPLPTTGFKGGWSFDHHADSSPHQHNNNRKHSILPSFPEQIEHLLYEFLSAKQRSFLLLVEGAPGLGKGTALNRWCTDELQRRPARYVQLSDVLRKPHGASSMDEDDEEDGEYRDDSDEDEEEELPAVVPRNAWRIALERALGFTFTKDDPEMSPTKTGTYALPLSHIEVALRLIRPHSPCGPPLLVVDDIQLLFYRHKPLHDRYNDIEETFQWLLRMQQMDLLDVVLCSSEKSVLGALKRFRGFDWYLRFLSVDSIDDEVVINHLLNEVNPRIAESLAARSAPSSPAPRTATLTAPTQTNDSSSTATLNSSSTSPARSPSMSPSSSTSTSSTVVATGGLVGTGGGQAGVGGLVPAANAPTGKAAKDLNSRLFTRETAQLFVSTFWGNLVELERFVQSGLSVQG
ncbi:hypothetical protein HK102_007833 [Quaeritorhiza haematococci]|nr:hypothetical protein HK102_007833 [Quaeritorhiza haematococci]